MKIHEIINDVLGVYKAHLENGADHIRLYYDDVKEILVISVRCCDDAYPYWVNSEPRSCSLKTSSVLLYYIVNGRLVNECTGEKYPISLEWDWVSC